MIGSSKVEHLEGEKHNELLCVQEIINPENINYVVTVRGRWYSIERAQDLGIQIILRVVGNFNATMTDNHIIDLID